MRRQSRYGFRPIILATGQQVRWFVGHPKIWSIDPPYGLQRSVDGFEQRTPMHLVAEPYSPFGRYVRGSARLIDIRFIVHHYTDQVAAECCGQVQIRRDVPQSGCRLRIVDR